MLCGDLLLEEEDRSVIYAPTMKPTLLVLKGSWKGAERELREALVALSHKKIQEAFLQGGIKRSFNPPTASHHAGVWECIIRMVQQILTSVLHQQTLDDEGFHTVLCEVEAIQLTEDPDDLEALTPNHLHTMKRQPVLPPGLFEKADLYIKRRCIVQNISDLLWKCWLREY